MTNIPARVRFAPSPTGRFHIGGARTALYNYLLARQTGGQFVLRIEDTDRKRFDPNAEKEIMESLHWLGLFWDEGPDKGGPYAPYRQSERVQLYHDLAQELIDRGHAYYCFCSPKRLDQLRKDQQKRKLTPHYDGLCRSLPPNESRARIENGESHVVRFKVPEGGKTIAVDLMREPILVDNSHINDYILIKSDGMPVYHMAAISDDHLMQITHVFRGSEWLATFPLHVLIYQAFEWEQPVWVHLSLFLNPTGKGKLSKRYAIDPKGGAMSVYVIDLREMGYLPEAVVNWCALMGWSYDDQAEIFSMDDLVEKFSLEKLRPSPAAVNYSKLDHFDGLYIRNLTHEELFTRIRPFFVHADCKIDDSILRQIIPLIQERINTLEDAIEIAGFFFRDTVHPDPNQLIAKNMTYDKAFLAAEAAYDLLKSLPSFSAEAIEPALRELASRLELDAGQLFWVLRIAITGQPISPPLIESMEIIGKTVVLERLDKANQLLNQLRKDN